MQDFWRNVTDFFQRFYSFPYVFEIVMASITAIIYKAHWRKMKSFPTKLIVIDLLSVLGLIASMTFIAAFFAGLGLAVNKFISYLMVFSVIVPGAIYLFVFSKTKWPQRIVKTLLFLSSIYVVTEIGHHVNYLTNGIENQALLAFVKAIPYLVMPATGVVVAFYSIDKYRNLPISQIVLAVVTFVAIFVVAILQSYNISKAYENRIDVPAFTHVLWILVMFMFLVLNLGFYVVLYDTLKKRDHFMEITAKSQMEEASDVMLKINEEAITKASHLYHDLKNHMLYLSGLMKEEAYDEAIQYCEKIGGDEAEALHIVNCGNRVVSSIFNLEYKKAELANVYMKYLISIDKEVKIREVDLVCFLTNIIDNAIESCVREKELGNNTSEGFDIIVQQHEESLRVVCKNKTSKTRVSNKSEKEEEGHGYGRKIIRSIAERYNGTVRFQIKDGYYVVDALLNMESEDKQ